MSTRTPRNDRSGGPTPEIKVGLVGLGYWGPNLLRVMAEMEGVEVVSICDLDEDRLARFARRYPSISPTIAVDDLIQDEELDAVVLATPVHSHQELASRALEAGKHTFVEKPLASTSAGADGIEAIRGGEGTDPHVWAYLPLQPSGSSRERPHGARRAR